MDQLGSAIACESAVDTGGVLPLGFVQVWIAPLSMGGRRDAGRAISLIATLNRTSSLCGTLP